MLVFVIPLQSPAASKNWAMVSRLANRCLASVLSQGAQEFKAILVCNEPPIGLNAHPGLTVIQRDFPFPGPTTEERMRDKWLKVRYGLAAAVGFSPCHVMVVDADDLVSNRLAAFVKANPLSAGWKFDSGIMHDEGSRLVYMKKHDFFMMCGSSSIVRLQQHEFPVLEEQANSHCIVIDSGHTGIVDAMEKRGTPLAPLPFPGALYVLGTGENDSGFSLKGWRSKKVMLQKLFNYRLLSPRIREEFSLFELNKTMVI